MISIINANFLVRANVKENKLLETTTTKENNTVYHSVSHRNESYSYTVTATAIEVATTATIIWLTVPIYYYYSMFHRGRS